MPLSYAVVWISFVLLAASQNFDLPDAAHVKPLPSLPGYTSKRHQYHPFQTEREFLVQNFNVLRIPKNRRELAPGKIFMAPMGRKDGWGPQIYDHDGTLIWRGDADYRAQNLQVCDYLGQKGTHLCYGHRISPLTDIENRTIRACALVVLDSGYNKVASFTKSFDYTMLDCHTFNMLEGGESFLSITRHVTTMDLTPYGGDKEGFVGDDCLLEIDVRTGETLFRWCYLDNDEIWKTHGFLSTQTINATDLEYGNGTMERPWDFIHANAAVKNSEGDYYYSARHLDSIFKIAGLDNKNGLKPGEFIWRLGGRDNDFELKGFKTKEGFTSQHDIRLVSFAENEERITLFNNGWDHGAPASQNYSEAQLIRLDTKNMRATLERSYPHPQRKSSPGRGGTQLLPNGNMLTGWGVQPEFSEFSSKGKLLYHVNFETPRVPMKEFSYRVRKYPWIGHPTTDPKLVVYSETCQGAFDKSSPIMAYVSWNGATNVKSWEFYMADGSYGPWVSAGNFPKNDFETRMYLDNHVNGTMFPPFVMVKALDGDGNVLGKVITETFVPKREIKPYCFAQTCLPRIRYTQDQSKARWCHKYAGADPSYSIAMAAVFVVFLEFLALLYHHAWTRRNDLARMFDFAMSPDLRPRKYYERL